MGILLSRFRKKQTTIEILEGIDKDISRLQKNRKVNQDRQKQFITSLLIYSITVYVFAAIVFFLVYFPDTWKLRFLYSLPLLVFPFIIWGTKKLLHWYFVKRIASNDLALQDLRERKKQILEDVMETETFKRAREILEKFDPARLRKLELGSTTPEAASGTRGAVTPTPGTAIHQRASKTVPAPSGSATATRLPAPATPGPVPATPRLRQPFTPAAPLRAPSQPTAASPPRGSAPPQPRTPFPVQPIMNTGYAAVPPSLPMPRTVLPRERGTMDKLMDYLVGDGPENRYALICQFCHSHNGMALKEEFEYLNFRCCYCYNLNPAKKQRPTAPKLEFFAPGGAISNQRKGTRVSSDKSEDEDDSNRQVSHRSTVSGSGSSSVKPVSSIPVSSSVALSAPSEFVKETTTSKPGAEQDSLLNTSGSISTTESPRAKAPSDLEPKQEEGKVGATINQAPDKPSRSIPVRKKSQESKLPLPQSIDTSGGETPSKSQVSLHPEKGLTQESGGLPFSKSVSQSDSSKRALPLIETPSQPSSLVLQKTEPSRNQATS